MRIRYYCHAGGGGGEGRVVAAFHSFASKKFIEWVTRYIYAGHVSVAGWFDIEPILESDL